MKLRATSIAIILAGVAGVALAGNPGNSPQPLAVSGTHVVNCTPPNGGTGHACDTFDKMLHASFTTRQIGILFGDRSSYPEYKTGDFDRLRTRYDALVQRYMLAQRQATRGTSVASAK